MTTKHQRGRVCFVFFLPIFRRPVFWWGGIKPQPHGAGEKQPNCLQQPLHRSGGCLAWGSLAAPAAGDGIIQAFRESTSATLFKFLCWKTYAGSPRDSVRASRFVVVVEKLMTTPPGLHAPRHTLPVEQRGNRVDPAVVVTGGAGAVITSWLRASSYSYS